jgi:hypothetical protein
LEANAALNQMKDSGVSLKIEGGERVHGQIDAESDVSIVGFVLQQRLPALLQFISHEAAALRLSSLQLLGTLLKQGMLCPLDLIDKLIGLQGDPDMLIRLEALRILQAEDERRPMFIDNRMLDGIEFAIKHQLLVCKTTRALDDFSEHLDCGEDVDMDSTTKVPKTSADMSSIFKSLYVSCIQLTFKRKLEFLNGCVRKTLSIVDKFREYECLFTDASAENAGFVSAASPTRKAAGLKASTSSVLPERTRSVAMSDVKQGLELLRYIILTLAYLPYELNEEPLTIIYQINKYVPLHAGLLLQRMKQTSLSCGASVRGEAKEMLPPAMGQRSTTASAPGIGSRPVKSVGEKTEDDGVGKRAWDEALLYDAQKFLSTFSVASKPASTPPSSSKPKSSGTSTSDPQKKLLCQLAVQSCQSYCHESLLRLKYFLKKGYNLSDERCSNYNPDDRANYGNSSSNNSNAASSVDADVEFDVSAQNNTSAPILSPSVANKDGSAALDRVRPADFVDLPVISIDVSNKTIWGEDTFSHSHSCSTLRVVEHTLPEVSQILTPLELSRTWARNSVANYNNLLVLMDGDPNDFTLAKKRTRVRSKTSPSTASSEGNKKQAAKRASKQPNKKAKPSVTSTNGSKRKKNRLNYGSSDDDREAADYDDFEADDDEEYLE